MRLELGLELGLRLGLALVRAPERDVDYSHIKHENLKLIVVLCRVGCIGTRRGGGLGEGLG